MGLTARALALGCALCSLVSAARLPAQLEQRQNACIDPSAPTVVVQQFVTQFTIAFSTFVGQNTIFTINQGITININNAPTTISTLIVATTTSTVTVQTQVTATATVLATLSPTPSAFQLGIAQPGQRKRQNSPIYIDANGRLNANISEAITFNVANSQLFANGNSVSVASGLGSSPFLGSPGQAVSTAFGLINGKLQWTNDAFYNGAAQFCMNSTDMSVYSVFVQSAPAGCSLISLDAFADVDGAVSTGSSTTSSTSLTASVLTSSIGGTTTSGLSASVPVSATSSSSVSSSTTPLPTSIPVSSSASISLSNSAVTSVSSTSLTSAGPATASSAPLVSSSISTTSTTLSPPTVLTSATVTTSSTSASGASTPSSATSASGSSSQTTIASAGTTTTSSSTAASTTSSTSSSTTVSNAVPAGSPFVMGFSGTGAKRAASVQYLDATGSLTTDSTLAVLLLINTSGQLLANGQVVSVNPGVVSQPFIGSSGSISTTFSFSNGGLVWTNSAFANTVAQFCLAGQQSIVYFTQSPPASCNTVSLTTIPLASLGTATPTYSYPMSAATSSVIGSSAAASTMSITSSASLTTQTPPSAASTSEESTTTVRSTTTITMTITITRSSSSTSGGSAPTSVPQNQCATLPSLFTINVAAANNPATQYLYDADLVENDTLTLTTNSSWAQPFSLTSDSLLSMNVVNQDGTPVTLVSEQDSTYAGAEPLYFAPAIDIEPTGSFLPVYASIAPNCSLSLELGGSAGIVAQVLQECDGVLYLLSQRGSNGAACNDVVLTASPIS